MELSFLEFGEKEKIIVFLHGWQQDKKSFSSLVPFLFKKYHLFLLDLPGFGNSDFPAENFNSFDYARVVADWIKERKLKEIVLVGHSFGGKVAAIIAEKNPKVVKKLVLIASSGIVEKEKYTLFKKLSPKFLKDFLRPYFVGRDYKEAGKLLPVFKTIVKEDISETFSKVKVPTLIIWGKDDKELSAENGKKINSLIERSQLKIVDGGHFPFWDNPQKVAELIDDFINEKN